MGGGRDGGLLALYPTVIEVVETAMTEEVDEGVAPIAPTDVLSKLQIYLGPCQVFCMY